MKKIQLPLKSHENYPAILLQCEKHFRQLKQKICYTSVLADYYQAIKIQFLHSHLLSFISENGLQQLQFTGSERVIFF